MRTKFYTFLVLFLISLTIFSQAEKVEIERSKNKVIIGGKIYYVHIVADVSHTLYSLSRLYNVSQKDICKENPDAVMGLKLGQALKIPFVPEQEIKTKKKKKYINHRIKKDDTVYSLSKFYNVSKEDILLANPLIDINDIPIASIIKIPMKEYTIQKNTVKTQKNFIYHKVKRKETLYSLSKKYNVSRDQIERANLDMNGYPKYGQYIRIPIIDSDSLETVMLDPLKTKRDSFYILESDYNYNNIQNINCDSMQNQNYYNTYKVGLLLPFFLDMNDFTPDSLIKDTVYIDPYGFATKRKRDKKIYEKSKYTLEFYEGFIIALDSLRRTGLNINLYVYDTGLDSLRMNEIMMKPEFDSLDLIIGRINIENLSLITDHFRDNPVNIVSPMPSNNDLIKRYANIFQVNPSFDYQLQELSKFISQYHDKNIVLVHDGDSLENKLISTFKEKIFGEFSFHKPIDQILFKEVIYQDSISFLEQAMLVDTENVVIVSSNKRPFVSKVITSLNTLNSLNYKITTFGFPRLLRFDNIDPDYLFNINTHVFTSYFINYDFFQTKRFIKKYRKKYKLEPTAYSFQGYDMAFYFLNALKKYGRQFQGCLHHIDVDLLQAEFKFKRISPGSGYENKAVTIVKYDDDYHIHVVEMPNLSTFSNKEDKSENSWFLIK